jgi:AraC-like DNA-binding protein
MAISALRKVDFLQLAPYVRYIHEYDGPGNIKVPPRYIYDHELVFFTHGGGIYTIDDISYTVSAGDLHVIRPHQRNSCVIPSGHARYFAVHFDFLYMGDMFDFPSEVYTQCDYTKDVLPVEEGLDERPFVEPDEVEFPSLIRAGDPLLYERLFIDLLNVFTERTPGYQLEMRALLLKILRLMDLDTSYGEEIVKKQPCQEEIDAVIRYVHEHYHESIDFSRLAADLALSPNYLRTMFKKKTGKSPMEYIIMCRMERAKELILEGKHPIKRISAIVGYVDAHYFSRLFKRYEKRSPKQYADTMLSSGKSSTFSGISSKYIPTLRTYNEDN